MIGSNQVTEIQMESAPGWSVDEVVVKEYTDNWIEDFELVERKSIPINQTWSYPTFYTR